jgi:organic radical activating enzyme
MPVPYRIVQMSLFDTCNLHCGYCTSNIIDRSQLIPYKEKSYIEKIVHFFNKRTTENEKWHISLTGGEPLLMPNFDYFSDLLLRHGNIISLYTNLAISSRSKSFQYLLTHKCPDFDYIMASLHPESERSEEEYFDKVRMLKESGHNIFLRYVGHHKRLGKLESLSEKCKEIDVCFYPTTLFSTNYPKNYSPEEKRKLSSYFSSLSQIIQINGGLDTSETKCFAGSRLIGVYINTGNITPCISVYSPIIGNIFEDRLNLFNSEIDCPQKNTPCICDIHFQQNIVRGVEDNKCFLKQKRGYLKPIPLEKQNNLVRRKSIKYSTAEQVIGRVKDEMALIQDRSDGSNKTHHILEEREPKLSLEDRAKEWKSLEITPASSLWNQRVLLAELKPRIRDLCKAIDWENDLGLYQWVQLLGFTLEYGPDLILELGRGRGNSTCLYTEAANHLPNCRVVSICNSDDWDRLSYPRVKQVVPGSWFQPLTILRGDILSLDYQEIIADSRRPLLFWDAHGFVIAECVLGGILPLLADRENMVIMHDISDNRYVEDDYFDYSGERIWHGGGKESARLCLGDYNSLQEQLVSIIDFTTRNDLTLHSADYSIHTELKPDREKMEELDRILGESFFRLEGHWFWFTLNEKQGPVFFPHYDSPADESVQSEKDSFAGDVSGEICEVKSRPVETGLITSDDEEKKEISHVDEIFAAEAYWRHRRELAESLDLIQKLYSSIGNETALSPFQWTQLIAFTLEFKPDLIIEIGRWWGNSTLVFNEAAYLLRPSHQTQVLSVWPSNDWKLTFDKIRNLLPEEWFESLLIYRYGVTDFPYEDHLGSAEKILVFLDDHSFEIAGFVLGKLMPLIAEREHAVLVHDISDARYYGPQHLGYGENGLWRTGVQAGESLIIDNVASSVELTISLLDFASRNGITLLSGDHSFQSFFNDSPEKSEEMRALLGPEFFSAQAHWRWFSLNETVLEKTFPVFEESGNQR